MITEEEMLEIMKKYSDYYYYAEDEPRRYSVQDEIKEYLKAYCVRNEIPLRDIKKKFIDIADNEPVCLHAKTDDKRYEIALALLILGYS